MAITKEYKAVINKYAEAVNSYQEYIATHIVGARLEELEVLESAIAKAA